jgi:hypothetical protein
MSWEMAIQKFNEIATPYASAAQRTAVADAVANLEQVSVRELMERLGTVGPDSDASHVVLAHKES